LNKAAQLDPDLPEVHYARALGFIIEGKYQAAKPELEEALAAKPGFTPAWISLGLLHQNLGDYSNGKTALEKAMQLEPGSFRVQVYFGNFYESFQEYEAALERYRKATELKPNSGTAWNNLGGTLLYTSRFDEAIPALLRSIGIEDNAHARSNLGTSYYFRGEFEEAVENYRRATELQPREAVHWGNLGDGLLALGQTEQAREAYGHAAELAHELVLMKPLKAAALMDLAVYCAKANDRACAKQHGSRAVELQPENAEVLLKHALVLCMLEEDDEALDRLDRAVRLGASRAQIEAIPEFSRFSDRPRYRAILDLAS
jgi:tetratricopeptide (TPR) repeat protein